MLPKEWSHVPVPRPSDGYADLAQRNMDYRFVMESLIGGLEYEGVVKWLALRPDLKTAVADAEKLSGGMVAT